MHCTDPLNIHYLTEQQYEGLNDTVVPKSQTYVVTALGTLKLQFVSAFVLLISCSTKSHQAAMSKKILLPHLQERTTEK
jgi:hypothetical protein